MTERSLSWSILGRKDSWKEEKYKLTAQLSFNQGDPCDSVLFLVSPLSSWERKLTSPAVHTAHTHRHAVIAPVSHWFSYISLSVDYHVEDEEDRLLLSQQHTQPDKKEFDGKRFIRSLFPKQSAPKKINQSRSERERERQLIHIDRYIFS